MPSFMGEIQLNTTAVNVSSEELGFFTDGILPPLVLGENKADDPATTCYLTNDLYMGAREAHRHAMPTGARPSRQG